MKKQKIIKKTKYIFHPNTRINNICFYVYLDFFIEQFRDNLNNTQFPVKTETIVIITQVYNTRNTIKQ